MVTTYNHDPSPQARCMQDVVPLCATSSLPWEDIVLEGFMEKESRYLERVRTRYFVLTPELLCSFKSQGAPSADLGRAGEISATWGSAESMGGDACGDTAWS